SIFVIGGDPPDIGDELVAPAGDGHDMAFAEQASQHGNGLREVVFFDHGRGPKRLDENLSRDEFPRVLDEIYERVERLGGDSERHPLRQACEHPPLRIETKAVEFVHFRLHRKPHGLSAWRCASQAAPLLSLVKIAPLRTTRPELAPGRSRRFSQTFTAFHLRIALLHPLVISLWS